jgi:hypothetical protein
MLINSVPSGSQTRREPKCWPPRLAVGVLKDDLDIAQALAPSSRREPAAVRLASPVPAA